MGSAHIERLESLLQSTRNATDSGVKTALTHLSSEIRERLARGSSSSFDFFSQAARVLSEMKGAAHTELRINCLNDCSRFFYLAGYREQALAVTAQFRQLAIHTKEKSWMRKATGMMGIVEADAGNVAEALLLYSESLQLAYDLNDVQSQAITLINIGVALNYAGLYREAIPCFSRSMEIVEPLDSKKTHHAINLGNLAQSHFYLGQHEKGFEAITQCLKMTTEPLNANDALNVVIREFTYVQLALELGHLSSAKEHCETCVRYGRFGNTIRGRFLADIAYALCEIHSGDVICGLSILENALAQYGDAGSYRIDALTALVKAYDEIGKPESALARMQDLLGYLRSARENSVQALLVRGRMTSSEHSFDASGLQAMELREARLRAEVAERAVQHTEFEMLERLAVTADLKEESSGEHGYRVGRLSSLVADELNWSREASQAIDLAARVHDIGKIGVPDRILLSSKELQEAERHFMSTHTVIGAELLAKSNIPQLRMAEDIARYHHEWWNGEGYPAKLSGKRIPLHARIVAIADVFDALTHGRPFAKPWPIDQALAEIRQRSGTQFDPELTGVFLELIAHLRVEHDDLDAFLGSAGKNSPFLQARNKIRLMLTNERENEKKSTVAGNATRH